jgi:hypothetical protein
MFIHSRRNASILKWRLGAEPIEDDPIPICALYKPHRNLSAVGEFIDLYLNGALDRLQTLACVVQMIPGRDILKTADQRRAASGQVKVSGVIRMFRRMKNSRPFNPLRRPELTIFCIFRTCCCTA